LQLHPLAIKPTIQIEEKLSTITDQTRMNRCILGDSDVGMHKSMNPRGISTGISKTINPIKQSINTVVIYIWACMRVFFSR